MRNERSKRLVVGVTIGDSAYSLLRGQLEWFQKVGWEVTLVCAPGERALAASKRENVTLRNIDMQRGISPVADLSSLMKWIKFLRSYRPAAINVGTPKAGLLGIVASWVTRVPKRLYVVRGLRLEGTSFFLRIILWMMEKITMSLATDVWFVSESLAAEAHRLKLAPLKKSWIIGEGSSNGVDFDLITRRVEDVNRLEMRKKLGFTENDVVIGYLGRINRDKGIDVLIRALTSPNLDERVRCLAIGAHEDYELGAALANIETRATVLPKSDDVWKYLVAMDAICLPTRREGFPNVVLEAAVVKVPAITTRATGAIDSVVPGKTGLLFDQEDYKSLVDQMNKLAQDSSLRAELGVASSERVKTRFRPELVWNGIQEILNGVASPVYAVRIKPGE